MRALAESWLPSGWPAARLGCRLRLLLAHPHPPTCHRTLQESGVAYLLRLDSGHKLRLLVYLCFDQLRQAAPEGRAGSGGGEATAAGSSGGGGGGSNGGSSAAQQISW